MKTGIERIVAERARQISKEGWDAAHDDEHDDGSLALAAICYAAPERVYVKEVYAASERFSDPWPTSWNTCHDKRRYSGNVLQEPTREQYIRQLEKAGALIAAEIDRLLRLKVKE